MANANFMVFFKSSTLVVDHLFRTFASIDMSFSEFISLSKKYWDPKYGYFVIDMSRDYNDVARQESSIAK